MKHLLCLLLVAGCVPSPRYVTRTGDTKSNVHRSSSNLRKEASNSLEDAIRPWLGTPYRLGMAEVGKGTDCSGFVGQICRTVYGMELPREAHDMYKLGISVDAESAQEGDLVFFERTYKGSVGASHVGIFIRENEFAHASTTVGVTYSKLSEPYYSKHFLGIRRLRK